MAIYEDNDANYSLPANQTISTDSFDWGQIVSDIAPTILQAAGNIAGAAYSTNVNNDLADDYRSGTAAAGAELNRGYLEQLGYSEQGADTLKNILDSSLADTYGEVDRGYDEYAAGNRGAVDAYRNAVVPAYQSYGTAMGNEADRYTSSLESTEGRAGEYLTDASQDYSAAYNPYIDAGGEGMAYLRSMVAQDPTQLTGVQQRAMDDYRDETTARLAASGLRGSGRAVTAAMAEGEAAMKANFLDQNQRRSDTAAQTLNNQGYTATGNVANNRMNLGTTLADMRYKTGAATAGNKQSVGQTVAGAGFDTARDIGGRAATAEANIANSAINRGKEKANLVGNYYQNLGNIEGTRYGNRGDTAINMAANNATVLGSNRDVNYNLDAANANLRGNTIGQISNRVNEDAKKRLASTTAPTART